MPFKGFTKSEDRERQMERDGWREKKSKESMPAACLDNDNDDIFIFLFIKFERCRVW